jgi:isoamylase
VRAIATDAVLSRAKLIAEPWDCGGLYQVGTFPSWERWAEWNGKFRDTLRRFVRGDAGQKPALATRMAGSADMYTGHGRAPWASVNYITAHDGFSLADLVSYSSKRNDANGEGGRDGTTDNDSWNCGAEGPSGDAAVLALRAQQMRNFALALLLAGGVPMLVMGDEYGHSKGGNNNTYGLDGPLNNFQWDQLEEARPDLFRFFAAAVAFRRQQPLLRRRTFLGPADVSWHEDAWDNAESRFLAWTLHAAGGGAGSLYVAFNAHGFPITEVPLPPPPHGCAWGRVADTALPPPRDFDAAASRRVAATYTLAPHSSIVLMAVPAGEESSSRSAGG